MRFGYRLHACCAATAVGASVLLAAAMLLGLPSLWRMVAAIPAIAGVAGGVFWLSGRARARELGAIVLDDEGLRRVRGDGRVLAVVRWSALRKIVLDQRRRMLLVEGPQANTLWCHGAGWWGGIGVERFDTLLDAIAGHTHIPFSPAAGQRMEHAPGQSGRSAARSYTHPAHA